MGNSLELWLIVRTDELAALPSQLTEQANGPVEPP